MSAALAGTKAAAAMKPAAAHVVQYFTGSLQVGGQKRARGLMPVISAFAPVIRAAAVALRRSPRLIFGQVFLFALYREVPKSRPVIGVACHRSIKLW